MITPMHRPDPGGGSTLPAGLILAPVIPHSSEDSGRVPATPALGGYPHIHQAASSDRGQGRAGSLHPQGAPQARPTERSRAHRRRTSAARPQPRQRRTDSREHAATASDHALDKPGANGAGPVRGAEVALGGDTVMVAGAGVAVEPGAAQVGQRGGVQVAAAMSAMVMSSCACLSMTTLSWPCAVKPSWPGIVPSTEVKSPRSCRLTRRAAQVQQAAVLTGDRMSISPLVPPRCLLGCSEQRA